MEFEWDEEKRIANIAKHAIDFDRARTIWDGRVIDPADERELEGEVRRMALGVIGEEISLSLWCIRSVGTQGD